MTGKHRCTGSFRPLLLGALLVRAFLPGGGVSSLLAYPQESASQEVLRTGRILFSTYLGGSSNDHGNGIVVDSTGVYITGGTSSSNFPTHTSLGPAPQAYHSRAFVAKLNLTGNSILYSTSLSGSLDASAEGITVDSMGTAWVAGYTASTDFPMAPGVTPLQAINHGGADAFIARLSATGASLLYSTYWGGSSA